ncbi:MAG: glycerol-3-phosphate dehydrogenase/oxidase [Deltaproteobacteria bacterium]|nr:glycerol-3-phosphate dehydrogenase/oxidase [Deltaproteobacteria bacterium]
MYDVAIIGGGINGLGVARDLAKRGLSVYLAEKSDFGVGATGNSSGMFHGGARYLLSDPHVVSDSCKDSGYVQTMAQNLVFRIPFFIPIYEGRSPSKNNVLLMDAFFSAYDDYQPLKHGLPHQRLNVGEALRIEPGIAREGLLGALTMDEWGVDTFRLCTLNALDARAHGAVIANHTEVLRLARDEHGRIIGFDVRDASGKEEAIRARLVVNCTGAWNNKRERGFGIEAKVRPGKGIHLVYDGRISDFAIVTFAVDGRQVFLMPHQNETWFGTTDDDYFGDPDALTVSEDDVAYCRVAAARVFPKIAEYRCFATSVGLRPTIHAWGPNEDDLSRDHAIIDHAVEGSPGVVSMIGGKLASYRTMTAELADEVLRLLDRPVVACRTHLDPLPGHEKLVDAEALARESGAEGTAVRRLVRRHGTRAQQILQQGARTPGGLATACACEPVLECEVRHVLQNEWVAAPSDLVRRCRVGVGPCLGLRCAQRVGQIYAEEKGGDHTTAIAAAIEIFTHAKRRALPVLDDALDRQLARVERALVDNGGAPP